jgi:hypothetical protein
MRSSALGVVCLVACGADAQPAPTCTGPAEPSGRCVDEVRGVATDVAGKALAGLGASVCGRVCFGATTDPDGLFRVKVGAVIDLSRYVVHLDGRPDHADVYVRLVDSVIASPLRAPALPADGAPLPPDGGRVTSGPLALDVPPGTDFALAFADATAGDRGRLVRVATVDPSSAPPFAQNMGLYALYAIAPAGAVASAKVGVSIRNDAGLAAQTTVEILTLEDDSIAAPLEAGTLRAVARGHVSADGRSIDTDPGEGITKLNWLGVR